MSQRIYFQDDAITLDLPDSPPVVADHWKIVPVTPLQVTHEHLEYSGRYHASFVSSQITQTEVDQFKPKLEVPCCSLVLQWTGGDEVKPLIHRVTLKGAKPPKNYFYIYYYLQVAGEGTVYPQIDL